MSRLANFYLPFVALTSMSSIWRQLNFGTGVSCWFIVTLLFIQSIKNETFAQPIYSLFLVGDAGKDTSAGPALQMLRAQLTDHPNSAVLFLGDNIYPAGLEGKEGSELFRKSEKKLLAQLEQTQNHPGHIVWVPGNHDWQAGKWGGHKLVQREQAYIEKWYREKSKVANRDSVVFIPRDGLPGPVVMRLPHNISLVAFDVQWWLQSQFFHKVPRPNGLSRKEVTRHFFAEFDSIIANERMFGQRVVTVSHHPMFSNGHHGGAKQPLRFLVNCTPLQLFGLIGLNRALVQDIPQPRYKKVRKKVLTVFEKHSGLIHVAGHEHSLQYFAINDDHFLVSGSGSKRSDLDSDRYPARFMDDRGTGFMRLDLMPDGTWQCNIFSTAGNGGLLTTFPLVMKQ